MTLAYSQPNESEATYAPQARGFGEEIEVIAAAASPYPLKAVLDGCATTASTGLTIATSAGVVWYDGVPYVVAADTATAATADTTDPRVDYVYYDVGLDNVVVASGTAAENPQPPDLDDDWVLLAELTITAALTTISASHIIDKRVIGSTPTDLGVVYVDPTNGTDPGSSAWAGWGRRPDLAFDSTADAMVAATTGDTIAMYGNEVLTAIIPTNSKKLKFVGMTSDAGWTWNAASPSDNVFIFTGDGTELHNLNFGTSIATSNVKAFVDGSGVDGGVMMNCRWDGWFDQVRIDDGIILGPNWLVQGNYFTNFATMIIIDGDNSIIDGNHFEDGYTGIAKEGAVDSRFLTISNNQFIDFRNYCFWVYNATVVGNQFKNTDTIDDGGSPYGFIRCEYNSTVVGNNFQAEFTDDFMSSMEMCIVAGYSLVSGNHFTMGNDYNGNAIATYTSDTGWSLITGNRIHGTRNIDNVLMELRNVGDAAIGNYIYMQSSGSNDDTTGIKCLNYKQSVIDNIFYVNADSIVLPVVPHSSGSTLMRGNRMAWDNNNEVFPIPQEAVQVVSAATSLHQNDEVMQISGTGAITLFDVSPYQWTMPASKTFTFQRKDSTNNSTINTYDSNDTIWYDGTSTYTSISLASDGAMVEIYFDGTHWVVLRERGTVNYT